MRKQMLARKSHAELTAQADASQLKRSLGVFELTMMGIGAIIGTGIFVLTGKAAAGTEHALGAGPALTISFMVTGLPAHWQPFVMQSLQRWYLFQVVPTPIPIIPLVS
jgi:basic amino acid/polyamine antiporter, APA family